MNRWKQKEFYIGTFDPVHHGVTVEECEQALRLTKEAGFNLLEITWRNREEATVVMEANEKVGIPTLLQDPSFGGIGSKDPGATEETVKENLEYYGKYSTILGYYVWDEPMESTFQACRELTDIFRRLAPDKLAFSVVLPSYGIYNWESSDVDWTNNGYIRYIDGYLKTVDPDIFSMDYYVFQINRKATDLRYYDLWRDLGYCRVKALELNKPQWFYYQGISPFCIPDVDCLSEMSAEKYQVQMYAALSYGVKQLSCYTSDGLLIKPGTATEKTHLYDAVKEINRRIMNLGNELLDKESVKIYHTGINEDYLAPYFLDRLEEDEIIAATGDELVLGRLTKDDDQYLMVTNQRFLDGNQGVIQLRAPAHVWAFNEDTATYEDLGVMQEIAYDLQPGKGILYRLSAN